MTDDDVKALVREAVNQWWSGCSPSVRFKIKSTDAETLVSYIEPVLDTLSTDLAAHKDAFEFEHARALKAETDLAAARAERDKADADANKWNDRTVEEIQKRKAAEAQRDATQRKLDEAGEIIANLVAVADRDTPSFRRARAFLSSIQSKEQSNG